MNKINFLFLLFFTLLTLSFEIFASDFKTPLIIGHRGASGHRPEHTLASYQLAIDMGADFIEPDLVITKDKVLVARHENEISETTDVAEKFAERKTTKEIDGEKKTGWFVEDFTLKELKTLRAKERLIFRDHSYDGQFEVPTFVEILELVKKQTKEKKRPIGIYPETKHPTYFAKIGMSLEEPLVKLLKKYKLNKKNSPIFIQSFELSSLKKLKKMIDCKLIFLIEEPQISPYDVVVAGEKTKYIDYLTPEKLKELSKTIYGIGPYKRYIIPTDKDDKKLPATELIKMAHAAGLKVHTWTMRSDSKYLHKDYKNDPQNEYLEFFNLGIDGVFSDFPDAAVKARETFLKTTGDKK